VAERKRRHRFLAHTGQARPSAENRTTISIFEQHPVSTTWAGVNTQNPTKSDAARLEKLGYDAAFEE
jgi:hypothetical protein